MCWVLQVYAGFCYITYQPAEVSFELYAGHFLGDSSEPEDANAEAVFFPEIFWEVAGFYSVVDSWDSRLRVDYFRTNFVDECSAAADLRDCVDVRLDLCEFVAIASSTPGEESR